MRRKRSIKQRGPWPLARLFREDSRAPVVWLALAELAAAAGVSVITPTREQLAAMIGIARLPSISAALSALVKAGWIKREIIGVQGGAAHEMTAKVLRITLRSNAGRSLGDSRRSNAGRYVGDSIGRSNAGRYVGSRANAERKHGVFIDRANDLRTSRTNARRYVTSLTEKGARPETRPDASAGAEATQVHGDDGAVFKLTDLAAGVLGGKAAR